MIIGYAKISDDDDKQLDFLNEFGCEQTFIDTTTKERPELEKMFSILRKGDVVVVVKLSKLARSVKHLLEIIEFFNRTGVGLVAITENINTTVSDKLLFYYASCFSNVEKDGSKERAKIGLDAVSRKRARTGRPKGLKKEAMNKALAAKALYEDGKLTISEILKQLEISRQTLYNYLRYLNVPINPTNTDKD